MTYSAFPAGPNSSTSGIYFIIPCSFHTTIPAHPSSELLPPGAFSFCSALKVAQGKPALKRSSGCTSLMEAFIKAKTKDLSIEESPALPCKLRPGLGVKTLLTCSGKRCLSWRSPPGPGSRRRTWVCQAGATGNQSLSSPCQLRSTEHESAPPLCHFHIKEPQNEACCRFFY